MNYPLANSSWDHEEISAIQEVINSGMYSMGDRVAKFEAEFAAFCSSKYCVMVNSGSSANLLMIAALRYRKEAPLLPGDEVIVPAVSWSTTYYPLYQYGLKLRFVDVDRDTLNFDLDQLKSAVTPRTRAILCVNLLGNPNDFSELYSLVEGRDIILLEDNCESMGALFGGKQAGTFGLMGTFSAFFSHHISTMEGGMIVTDDEELYHIMLSLRAHGWTRSLPKSNKVTAEKSDDEFTESFKFVLPGYNLRPLEMSGAIGSVQLKKLPSMILQRRRNAIEFASILAEFPYIRIQKEVGSSSWFGFSMIVTDDAPFDRQALVSALRENEVAVRPIVAGNFAKNEVLRWFNYDVAGSLVHAEEVDRAGLFIGNHHYPLESEWDALQLALEQAAQQR